MQLKEDGMERIKGFYARKKAALKSFVTYMKKTGESEPYIRIAKTQAALGIDFYIDTYSGIKKCKTKECLNKISDRNKSGYCRVCYLRIYRKTNVKSKAGDARRARKYRRNRKVKILKGEL